MSKMRLEDLGKHIEIINSEMGQLRDEMKRHNDMLVRHDEKLDWVQKFQWLILATSISSMLMIIIQGIVRGG